MKLRGVADTFNQIYTDLQYARTAAPVAFETSKCAEPASHPVAAPQNYLSHPQRGYTANFIIKMHKS